MKENPIKSADILDFLVWFKKQNRKDKIKRLYETSKDL